MNTPSDPIDPGAPVNAPRRNRWHWIGLGAAVCALAWIAVIIGLASGVGFGTRLVLVTVAAVATEGLFWLAAAMLGISALQARHAIWKALKQRLSGHAD